MAKFEYVERYKNIAANISSSAQKQNAKIIESKVDYDEDLYATYNLTLRMNHEITFEELDSFLQTAGEIKSVSFTTVNN